MNNKRNKSKEVYATTIRRSEYDDVIMRNNARTGNRLRNEMQYQTRAQKVIMKELGKESLLLQNKLENDRKTISLGLYGSRFGLASTSSSSTSQRKTNSVPPLTVLLSKSSSKPEEKTLGRAESTAKLPWERDVSDKDSVFGRESIASNATTSMTPKSRLKTSHTSYTTARAQSDDFLASILNEAMNDEILYAQSADMNSSVKSESPAKSSASPKRKIKSSRKSASSSTKDSIVNSLVNAQP